MGEEFLAETGGQKRGKSAAFQRTPPEERRHQLRKTVELETNFRSKNISPCQFFKTALSFTCVSSLSESKAAALFVSHGSKQVTKTSPSVLLGFVKEVQQLRYQRRAAGIATSHMFPTRVVDGELRKGNHMAQQMCSLEKTVMGERC